MTDLHLKNIPRVEYWYFLTILMKIIILAMALEMVLVYGLLKQSASAQI